MAEPRDRKSGKDVGSDSPASKETADRNRPSSQADGDPGPEETKESDKLRGEGRGSAPRTGTARGEDEATVHEE